MHETDPSRNASLISSTRQAERWGSVRSLFPLNSYLGAVLALGALLAAGGCSPDASSASRNEQARIEELAATWKPYQAPRDPANLFDRPTGAPPKIDPSVAPTEVEGTRPLWKITAYQEWDLPQTAEDSLARIGEDAVPAVAQALRHPDPARRLQAARILARIGPSAAKAVPTLIVALEDQQPEVRKAVARALGQIGPAASAAVQPLLKTIEADSATEEQ
jgi:HEAT repeats